MPSKGNNASTDYFYQEPDTGKLHLKKLSLEECKEIVRERVHEFLREYVRPNAVVLAGISGGGDSNAMLHALTSFRDYQIGLRLVCVTGIPEWDRGLERAQTLCKEYGLDIVVVDSDRVRDLLRIKSRKIPLPDLFQKFFLDDDFEFLGTLIVRLALSSEADRLGKADLICLGLNLEDLLSEALYFVLNGRRPASVPVRRIGIHDFCYPLWLVPKRIIDGCFPSFSLDNYESRYPCRSPGRSLYYLLATHIQSRFPCVPERLLQGLIAMTGVSGEDSALRLDEDLGFHVLGSVPSKIKERFRQMIAFEPTLPAFDK